MRLRKKEKTEIVIDDKKLSWLYNRLVATTQFGKQLYEINTSLGSCREPHDYAQETLITLVKKIKENKVHFFTDSQLWAYCSRILGWQLLSQHRDYTICKMRKGRTVDIGGESEYGTKTEDIVSNKYADKVKSVESVVSKNRLKDYILAYCGTNCEIVKIGELFNLNPDYSLVSMYKVMESVDNYGPVEGLKQIGIAPWQQQTIIEAITEFMEVEPDSPHTSKPAERVLGSREKLQLEQMKKEVAKRPKFDIFKYLK